mgnify:CR=1 FL=1
MMKPARRRHEAVSVPAALRRVRLCRRAKARLRARFARTAPGRWHGRPLRWSLPPCLSFVRSFCFTRRAAARMISFSHSTPSLSLFCRFPAVPSAPFPPPSFPPKQWERMACRSGSWHGCPRFPGATARLSYLHHLQPSPIRLPCLQRPAPVAHPVFVTLQPPPVRRAASAGLQPPPVHRTTSVARNRRPPARHASIAHTRRRQPAVFACAQTHPKGEGTSAAGAERPLRRLHHPATPARPPRRLRRPATAARPPHHFRRPQPPPSRPPCLHRPHSPPATGGFCVRANAPKGRRDKRRRRGAPATPSPSPYNPRPSAAPPLA